MAVRNDELHRLVWTAAGRVGLSAPRIADEILGDLFPRTLEQARHEGGERMVRLGFIEIVKPILRAANDDGSQFDLGDIDVAFAPMVRPLRSNSYYVESLDEHVPLSRLIERPDLLDDARRYMRRKGNECLDEAARLDQLFDAVMAGAVA